MSIAEKYKKANLDPQEPMIVSHMYQFILNIEVEHQRWQKKYHERKRPSDNVSKNVLKIEFALVIEAIYSVLRDWSQMYLETAETS